MNKLYLNKQFKNFIFYKQKSVIKKISLVEDSPLYYIITAD